MLGSILISTWMMMEVFGHEFAELGRATFEILRLILLEASLAKVLGQVEPQMAKPASRVIPCNGMAIVNLLLKSPLVQSWT